MLDDIEKKKEEKVPVWYYFYPQVTQQSVGISSNRQGGVSYEA